MTCEIAVMNKFGAALAADSAVTVGNGEKIYHHAQKLFALAPTLPIGIMISGIPEIMGVPWEIVVKSYARQLGERRFDHLNDYALDFLAFVESSITLFPDAVQRDWFRALVRSYWRDQFVAPSRPGGNRVPGEPSRISRPTLVQLLRKDHATWQKYSNKSAGFLHFRSIPGDKVLSDYGVMLDHLEREIFGVQARKREVRQALRTTVKHMYDKQWFHPYDQSWIAFVGMGESEPFPVLQEYLVGSIVSGGLRWAKTNEAEVSREYSAHVIPLAQGDVIDMFFRGIEPGLDAKLESILVRSVSCGFALRRRSQQREQLAKVKKKFRRLLEEEIDEKYEAPLIAAVDAMPQQGLVTIAEMMVNLTAFRKRISIEQKETVGGATNVAVVSKGDGFVWIKHVA